MTVYEHVMLGTGGALAAGLHRRYGWQIVAMAGVAAALPDWDGISLLFGPVAFDRFHRALGHNLLACSLSGAALAALDYYFDASSRMKRFVGRRLRLFASREDPPIRSGFSAGGLCVWVVVGTLASLSHLAADLVFSGHAKLSDWGLQLLWPFSDRAWVYPLVPWGDVGTTLIFALGMLAMVRWPSRIQAIAALTLTGVLGYIGTRGFLVG